MIWLVKETRGPNLADHVICHIDKSSLFDSAHIENNCEK